ncbi:MAG: hypothetical protein AB8B83_03360 [Bdellovibrionales bacterium]
MTKPKSDPILDLAGCVMAQHRYLNKGRVPIYALTRGGGMIREVAQNPNLPFLPVVHDMNKTNAHRALGYLISNEMFLAYLEHTRKHSPEAWPDISFQNVKGFVETFSDPATIFCPDADMQKASVLTFSKNANYDESSVILVSKALHDKIHALFFRDHAITPSRQQPKDTTSDSLSRMHTDHVLERLYDSEMLWRPGHLAARVADSEIIYGHNDRIACVSPKIALQLRTTLMPDNDGFIRSFRKEDLDTDAKPHFETVANGACFLTVKSREQKPTHSYISSLFAEFLDVQEDGSVTGVKPPKKSLRYSFNLEASVHVNDDEAIIQLAPIQDVIGRAKRKTVIPAGQAHMISSALQQSASISVHNTDAKASKKRKKRDKSEIAGGFTFRDNVSVNCKLNRDGSIDDLQVTFKKHGNLVDLSLAGAQRAAFLVNEDEFVLAA